MTDRKRSSFRFSLKTLIASVTLLAVGIGGWISYSNYKIQRLRELRQQGAIVILRDRTPSVLQAIGIKQLPPFYSVPTVELYVTPRGAGASIGNSQQVTSKAVAQKCLQEIAMEARSYGAEDIQLIVIDSFESEWIKFASENSMSAIGDSQQRYLARLKANQDSGANINP